MPRVARLEASRRTRIPSLSRQALGLSFEAQTEKPSSDGFVAIPPNPTYTARPHHSKRRARQAFQLRCPDGLLSLASFLDLATTDAPALCPRLHLALLAPSGSHLIPSATGSLKPSLLVSPLLGGTASVGDSPRGPLKQQGKPHLKPGTKPKNIKPNHAGA
jgi:hypothetical protein